MSAMKSNGKLISRAKKKRIGSCKKDFFVSLVTIWKTEKMFVNSQVSYIYLVYHLKTKGRFSKDNLTEVTTARENQNICLTNGNAVNCAPEVRAKSLYLLLWCCFDPSFSSFLPVWRGSCLLALSLQWYSRCLVGWLVWRLPVYAKLTGCSSNQSHNEPRESET